MRTDTDLFATPSLTPRPTTGRAEQLLAELVDIDSPTPLSSGVDQVQGVIARELLAMGLEIRFCKNPLVTSGQLIVAEIVGRQNEFVSLVAHADTVLSTEATGMFENLGNGRARGSGVIDNKGGVVVALEGLRSYLASRAQPELSLRFICSPNEEAGSTGFHEMLAELSRDSIIVLGFEPALEDGSIVQSRRGNRWYDLHIQGREAHAGRCRGEQINAAHELAKKIVALQALDDPQRGIGVNIGHIEAGRDRYNVVCGEARAKLDTRFANFADRDHLHREITRILETPLTFAVDGTAAQTTFSIADDCPPFEASSASVALTNSYLRAVQKIEGHVCRAATAGGAGDVNYMSREGLIVLDGLGPIGGQMHTPNEFIEIESLATRAQALAWLLQDAAALLELQSRAAAPDFVEA